MTPIGITQWAAAIIAVGGATEVVRRLVLRLRHMWRRGSELVDHVVEVHGVVVAELMPSQNGRLSLVDRVRVVEEIVTELRVERSDGQHLAR